ncbi:zinc finger MYM-type protein 1-like [Lepeophtheirus salmonis]|uniref:zinc finger MYM-type protein 1-like n=1 Tax=Lepeophtheirus salmonis TaxID=72036 RepID=UPI001AE779FA|nr:uncharacterized protein LOC121128826 [Lepeophtheirus salmonis]
MNVFFYDDEGLDRYVKRSISFTSPQVQEERIQMFSAEIVRTLVAQIAKDGPFGVMVDGTYDITGVEQEAICFHHVDENLDVHEEFVGLYELPSTSGEMISKMILDVITRLSLLTDNLRAQTYDGAANILGLYKGWQAKVKECQPLALNFHYVTHLANLIMQHAVSDYPVV